MRLMKRVPSGREKDQAAIEQLERLREKIYCDNPSVARHAAFNLSWMQEDGFEILKEALYGNGTRTTKSAAAYGLRKMRGRMKKNAMALLQDGLKHENEGTRQVCAKAQRYQAGKGDGGAGRPAAGTARKPGPGQQRRFKPKFRISEISQKGHRVIPPDTAGEIRRSRRDLTGENNPQQDIQNNPEKFKHRGVKIFLQGPIISILVHSNGVPCAQGLLFREAA